jgi:hypothetical protein
LYLTPWLHKQNTDYVIKTIQSMKRFKPAKLTAGKVQTRQTEGGQAACGVQG